MKIADNNPNIAQMVSFMTGRINQLWERENKMLVSSTHSFYENVFQSSIPPGILSMGLYWKTTTVTIWIFFPLKYPFNSTTQSRLLTTLKMKAFENIVGKGENAGNQHFPLFPQCFLPFPPKKFHFWVAFIFSSTNAFNLDQSKNLSFGKGWRSW